MTTKPNKEFEILRMSSLQSRKLFQVSIVCDV